MTTMRTTSGAKIALAARKLRENTPDFELAAAEPLAIIGIGCRFAGGVTDSELALEVARISPECRDRSAA